MGMDNVGGLDDMDTGGKNSVGMDNYLYAASALLCRCGRIRFVLLSCCVVSILRRRVVFGNDGYLSFIKIANVAAHRVAADLDLHRA